MEKGKLYISEAEERPIIVLCTENSTRPELFEGVVVSSNDENFPEGYYEKEWLDFTFHLLTEHAVILFNSVATEHWNEILERKSIGNENPAYFRYGAKVATEALRGKTITREEDGER
jgi:hypothetical protein